jgi:hypothetical protein
MKKLIAVAVAVLCFLSTGCVSAVRDRGLYGVDIPITEQSILIIQENNFVTSFNGEKVRWGKKHHLFEDWTTGVQIRIPSGKHDLTFKFNTTTYDRRGYDVVFKNTITKEFLPGHCYYIAGALNNGKQKIITFFDRTKVSGSENFVEDKDGNWVTGQPK